MKLGAVSGFRALCLRMVPQPKAVLSPVSYRPSRCHRQCKRLLPKVSKDVLWMTAYLKQKDRSELNETGKICQKVIYLQKD